MDPRQYTISQWIALAAVSIQLIAGASWWSAVVSPDVAVMIHGVAGTITSILMFMLTGKAPESVVAPPKAA